MCNFALVSFCTQNFRRLGRFFVGDVSSVEVLADPETSSLTACQPHVFSAGQTKIQNQESIGSSSDVGMLHCSTSTAQNEAFTLTTFQECKFVNTVVGHLASLHAVLVGLSKNTLYIRSLYSSREGKVTLSELQLAVAKTMKLLYKV